MKKEFDSNKFSSENLTEKQKENKKKLKVWKYLLKNNKDYWTDVHCDGSGDATFMLVYGFFGEEIDRVNLYSPGIKQEG